MALPLSNYLPDYISALAVVVRYVFFVIPLDDPETDPALALVPGLRG